ncbi:MAG: hypothetical protein ABIV21_05025 [Pyrinomonadaceae bacterium]
MPIALPSTTAVRAVPAGWLIPRTQNSIRRLPLLSTDHSVAPLGLDPVDETRFAHRTVSDSSVLSALTSPVNIGTDTHAAKIAKITAAFQYVLFLNFLFLITVLLPACYLKSSLDGLSSVAQCGVKAEKDIRNTNDHAFVSVAIFYELSLNELTTTY